MSRLWKARPRRWVRLFHLLSLFLLPTPCASQTYCSEDCQNIDSSSPSISSASSALSSPHLDGIAGGDVPPLVPSALGSALHRYKHSHDHHSVSSSASSTSWSVVTDDDYDGSALATPYESGFHGSVDSFYESSSKSAHYPYAMKPSALSYARRPSGTNNRSTVANLHKRTSSEHVHGPRSAPLQSFLSTDDDGVSSDFGPSSRDESDTDVHPTKNASTATKSRRYRNRASLPTYFSLLQMTTASTENPSPSMSYSPAQTIARPSPPTPKMPLSTLTSGLSRSTSTVLTGSIHTTPRGRRRIPTDSRISSSHSESPSPGRTVELSSSHLRSRLDSKSSVEQVFDWSSVPECPRGRAAVRRNSSPPQKMNLSTIALEDHNRSFATVNKGEALRPGLPKNRGRVRAEEFFDISAPGLGHGRSGLLDRERRGTHFV